MSRPYPPEPHTHYDGADSHGYSMHDVLDPEELNALVDELERRNIVYIKGIAHLLTWYGEPDEQGHRAAKLEVWTPF